MGIMEKKMETTIYRGYIGFRVPELRRPPDNESLNTLGFGTSAVRCWFGACQSQ